MMLVWRSYTYLSLDYTKYYERLVTIEQEGVCCGFGPPTRCTVRRQCRRHSSVCADLQACVLRGDRSWILTRPTIPRECLCGDLGQLRLESTQQIGQTTLSMSHLSARRLSSRALIVASIILESTGILVTQILSTTRGSYIRTDQTLQSTTPVLMHSWLRVTNR